MSQGANPILDVELLDDRPRLEALFAILVTAPLLILLTIVGIAHARAVDRQGWHARLPVVWLDGVDTRTAGGRAYQAVFLVLFVLLPALALLHFANKVAGATVVRRSDGATLGPFDLVPAYNPFDDPYRIGDTPDASEGVSWYPVIEPILLAILVLSAWICTGRLLWILWHDRDGL